MWRIMVNAVRRRYRMGRYPRWRRQIGGAPRPVMGRLKRTSCRRGSSLIRSAWTIDTPDAMAEILSTTGPPGGSEPRSARRSGMRPARWPRSPPATRCRGRPRTARSSPTPTRCWSSRSRPEFSASTRPAAEDPAGRAASRPGGGCGLIRGTPGSSTWPALRACSGNGKAAPGLP
jgi:hypothetical protein